jgi:hypothetical protein
VRSDGLDGIGGTLTGKGIFLAGKLLLEDFENPSGKYC